MDYSKIIDFITEEYKKVLCENLVGIYVHGSIAMQCFNPDKSDIDFLVVVETEPDISTKKQLMDVIAGLEDGSENIPAMGIEMSVVMQKVCREFEYPTPFILHYSPMHMEWYRKDWKDYCSNMKGIDKDLAAHFTIIREYGITWWGKPIPDLFGEVPREYYFDSIMWDIEEAKIDILENPVYIILNLCRVAAYSKEGLILSKKQGGEWGCRNLPRKYAFLVDTALKCYGGKLEMKVEEQEGNLFCEYLCEIIRKEK